MINPEFPENCIANFHDWTGVIEPITREQFDKWMVAVRSGNYIKGVGRLKSIVDGNVCHCVLGVFAEEEGKLVSYTKKRSDGCTTDVFAFMSVSLGYDAELGISTLEGDENTYYMPSRLQQGIYAINDLGYITWEEIATKIETLFGIEQ